MVKERGREVWGMVTSSIDQGANDLLVGLHHHETIRGENVRAHSELQFLRATISGWGRTGGRQLEVRSLLVGSMVSWVGGRLCL
jgi:hypothetical protein